MQLPPPRTVIYSLTSACCLHCEMCRSGLGDVVQAPGSALLDFTERLASWLPKGAQVILTGGEPLMHPDIFDVIRRIADGGLLPALNTNGALLRVETVERLRDCGLRDINFSLDGPEEIHDKVRNGPGLFRGVTDMIHYLSAQTDWRINIVSVIHALNAGELPGFIRGLYRREDFRINVFKFQAIIPTLASAWEDSFFDESPLWPRSAEEKTAMARALDRLAELKGEGLPIENSPAQFRYWRSYFDDPRGVDRVSQCSVGENNLLVMPDGSVTFCSHHGRLGDLGDDPRALWNSEQAAKLRSRMARCKKSCNFRVNCCFPESVAAK